MNFPELIGYVGWPIGGSNSDTYAHYTNIDVSLLMQYYNAFGTYM